MELIKIPQVVVGDLLHEDAVLAHLLVQVEGDLLIKRIHHQNTVQQLVVLVAHERILLLGPDRLQLLGDGHAQVAVGRLLVAIEFLALELLLLHPDLLFFLTESVLPSLAALGLVSRKFLHFRHLFNPLNLVFLLELHQSGIDDL